MALSLRHRSGKVLVLLCKHRLFSEQARREVYINYIKILHKKFKFYVHPDFFGLQPEFQAINLTNLHSLQIVIDALKVHNTERKRADSGPRSLIFYIKAGASPDMPAPRRVKLGLTHLHDSMREILEDYNAELPLRPTVPYSFTSDGFGSSSSTTFRTRSIQAKDVDQFLDSLLERRDLLDWREQRRVQLSRITDIVRETLGVDAVEMRYNWSAANNAKMFRSLLALIEETHKNGYSVSVEQMKDSSTRKYLRDTTSDERSLPRAKIYYPWKGLKLVLTNDDCSSMPVNTMEGEVQLCPGHVPLQWLEAITSVDAEIVRRAQINTTEIKIMEEAVSESLSRKLLRILILSGLSAEDQRAVVGNVSIKVCKGFTCNASAYGFWLKNFLDTDNNETVDEILQTSKTTDFSRIPQAAIVFSDNLSPQPKVYNKGGSASLPSYHETRHALLESSSLWLTQLPLIMNIVCEHGHGSKPLPTGDIRIDARANRTQVIELLQLNAIQSIKTSALQKRQRFLVTQLRDDLVSRLQLRSLVPGIGVSEEEFFNWMELLRDALNFPERSIVSTSGLKSLRGLAVRVGKYLGLSDDGSVILPLEMPLGECE